MRPVRFPLVAAHHPPSQATVHKFYVFWTLAVYKSVTMVITTVKAIVSDQGPLLT
jgi:hypothetical protein